MGICNTVGNCDYRHDGDSVYIKKLMSGVGRVMNGVEKMIMRALVDELKHVQKVYRSLSERGKYPQELCPFDLMGEMSTEVQDHPLYLGKQGFVSIQLAIDAAEEIMSKNSNDMKDSIGE